MKNYNKIIIPTILAFITELVYFPSLKYPFEFDDISNIIKFFKIRSASFTDLFFSGPRWISYWINTICYNISNFSPVIYRQLNILFHITSGILLFYLVFKLLSKLNKNNFLNENRLYISAITAALFLLHPVQSQTVSYIIQGQLEGLAALFSLIILNLFVLFTEINNQIKKYIILILIVVTAVISTGTKEITIVTPFLCLLIDWFFISQANTKKLSSNILLHSSLILVILSSYLFLLKPSFFKDLLYLNHVSYNNLGNIITSDPSAKITPLIYFISQYKVILHYILIFIFPFSLSVEYDWKLVESFASPTCFIPFIIILLIFGFTFNLLRKNKTNSFAFGIIWFFLCILPRSSIIPSTELVNDYKTYLSSIGIFFIFAILLVKLLVYIFNNLKINNHKKSNFIYLILLIISGYMGLLTYTRNLVWSSPVAFWQDIINKAPEKPRAYNNYGVALIHEHRIPEAILAFKTAIKKEGIPKSIKSFYFDPYNNLANAYSLIGETDLAINILSQSIKFNPYLPEPYNNLGMFYLKQKNLDLAEKAFLNTLKIRPHHGKAMLNIAKVYLLKNKPSIALSFLDQACSSSDLDSDPAAYIKALNIYTETCIKENDFEKAIKAYKYWIKYEPRNLKALFNLAGAYTLVKDYENAIYIYEKLLSLNPNEIKIMGNLSELYILSNQINKANNIINKALKLSPNSPGLLLQKAKVLINLNKNLEAQVILTRLENSKNTPGFIKNIINQIKIN